MPEETLQTQTQQPVFSWVYSATHGYSADLGIQMNSSPKSWLFCLYLITSQDCSGKLEPQEIAMFQLLNSFSDSRSNLHTLFIFKRPFHWAVCYSIIPCSDFSRNLEYQLVTLTCANSVQTGSLAARDNQNFFFKFGNNGAHTALTYWLACPCCFCSFHRLVC